MKVIEIDAQERLVWLAWDDGWRQANGHILKIHGIELSAVPLIVSRVIEKVGVAKLNARIEHSLEDHVRQFGPMPAIEIAEEGA